VFVGAPCAFHGYLSTNVSDPEEGYSRAHLKYQTLEVASLRYPKIFIQPWTSLCVSPCLTCSWEWSHFWASSSTGEEGCITANEAISLPGNGGVCVAEINSSALAFFLKVAASILELMCLKACLYWISWSNKRYYLSLQACSALLSLGRLSFTSCCWQWLRLPGHTISRKPILCQAPQVYMRGHSEYTHLLGRLISSPSCCFCCKESKRWSPRTLP